MAPGLQVLHSHPIEGGVGLKTVATALAGALIALLVVGAFMALDRTVLHLYSEAVPTTEDVTELRGLADDVSVLQTRVRTLESAHDGSSGGLERLVEMWAVERVGESVGHPQAQACINYVLIGTGSFVECGFVRSDD